MPRDGDGLHLVGAIWHFRYRSSDGRWKEKSTGKHKITEAKAERTRFLRAFADGDGLHLVGAIWHFRYRSSDGRWKEKSTGKHKITEAKAERTRFLRAFADG